jgi:inorganic triphosphatase YgiF
MAKAQPISGLDPQAQTTRNARIILQHRLNDMYIYAPYVTSPDNIRELHDLRIAAKRVRYTLELFEEFLPAMSKDFAEELARLQDELGALHDSEVMLTLLRQLLQQKDSALSTHKAAELSEKRPPALLSPGMADAILHPTAESSLSLPQRQGLLSFLRRQEQRRAEAYALFRQHWDMLEQRHFREAMIDMLNTDE